LPGNSFDKWHSSATVAPLFPVTLHPPPAPTTRCSAFSHAYLCRQKARNWAKTSATEIENGKKEMK